MDSIDITPTKGFPHMYDFIGDKVTKGSPIVLVVLTFVIIIYYILFSYLGVSVVEGPTAIAPSPSITFIEVVMWGMFIFLVLINGVQYFFQVVPLHHNKYNIYNKSLNYLDYTSKPALNCTLQIGGPNRTKY